MTVESATYINGLNASNPDGSTANISEGDDHLRLLKSTIKATFPNVAGVVSATHTQLSFVTGVTSAIQTQLNTKGAHAGQTWTGTHNFTGATLTAATQTVGTNNTTVATTAFVMAAAGVSPWAVTDTNEISYAADGSTLASAILKTGGANRGIVAVQIGFQGVNPGPSEIGAFYWFGGHAGGEVRAGAAGFEASNVGSATTNDGTTIDILTKTTGNGTASRAMRIDDSQQVGIGTGTGSITAKLDVNADKIRVRTAKTPSSASDTGNAGDICWDSDYVYVCVATDTWKRAALSTWP
jgi:hypothetical protein